MMIECMTDNRRRTAPVLRLLLGRAGGELQQTGSAAFNFERQGWAVVALADSVDEDELIMAALEAGSVDCEKDEDGSAMHVRCEPGTVHAVAAALRKAGYDVESALEDLVPTAPVDLSDEAAEKLEALLDALDAEDDVHSVVHNARLP